MNEAKVKLPLIRLHILANSNQDFDQKVKLQIRDRICSFLRPNLNSMNDLSQARCFWQKRQKAMVQLGRSCLQKAGASYGIRGEWGIFAFPACRLLPNSCFLPAGNYEALRLILGKGEGKNWFCVLFPDLCGLEEQMPKEEDEIWSWFENW